MVAGTHHQITMTGTIQADGVNPLDSVESNMIGAQKYKTFELDIYEYDGTFYVDNQNYTLDGSELVFPLNPLVLSPFNNDVSFYYEIETQDGTDILESLIQFNDKSLDFTVQSTT